MVVLLAGVVEFKLINGINRFMNGVHRFSLGELMFGLIVWDIYFFMKLCQELRGRANKRVITGHA